MKADIQFWRELKANQRNNMTKQQYRTIKGQAVKGKYWMPPEKAMLRKFSRGGITA